MFARTSRLLLRPAFAEDAAQLAQAIGDEAVVRNLATAPWPYGEADAEQFIASAIDEPLLPVWVMLLRTAGLPKLIGGVGIHRRNDGALELGYWVARRFWGLGFATEAGCHAVRTARAMQLPKLTAGHFTDNPASGAVLRKLGFHSTGEIAPRYSLARGSDAPCALFEEGDAPPDEARPMWRDGIDGVDDPREAIRLMAA
jgi:RimJ/RimL family protein N-acetyltransferase